MDKEEKELEKQPVVNTNAPKDAGIAHGLSNDENASIRIDKKAMPFAWIALISSIIMLMWSCIYFFSYFGLLIHPLEDTSYGEATAWILIFGTVGGGLIGLLVLAFGLLSKESNAKDNHKKNRMLFATKILCIVSVVLAVTAWIVTFVNSR